MRNKQLLLLSFLLWYDLGVCASEEQSQRRWPRRNDVNEWPVSLQAEGTLKGNCRRWLGKKDIDNNYLSWLHSPTSQSCEFSPVHTNDSDRSMYEPFDDVVQAVPEQCSEVKEQIHSLRQSPQVASHVPSHVSSIDSFFQGDFGDFVSCNDPLCKLEGDEETQRLIILDMYDNEKKVIDEWLAQQERLEQEYVDDVQYLYWYDALCEIILLDSRAFTVMHCRKGSFKWRGINSDLEKTCVELLNYCDARRHLLWQECVRSCSIYVNHAMLVAGQLYRGDS